MLQKTAIVRGSALLLEAASGDHVEIAAESEAWFAWLESALTFKFDDPIGRFSARKKRRRGAEYWYAFFRRGGRLHETYLGKARAITIGRLRAIAAKLNDLASQRPPTETTSIADIQTRSSDAPRLDDMDAASAKLGAPPIQADRLVRTRAVNRLAGATASTLTVVSAPAGYGKTTLLAQWIASSRLPTVWVTLDERDNDPLRFQDHLFAAIAHLMPSLFEAEHKSLGAAKPNLPRAKVPAIIEMLALTPFRTVLVLDDYHEIAKENTVLHDIVANFAERLPPRTQLVLASRITPPLPIAHLRAQNRLLELHATDLRFTQAETGVFLTQRMQLDLTDEEIAMLQERTEGWIAGLQLAALSLREQTDTHHWITTFGGENRYIFDYLMEQVVNRLPDDLHSFVLQTALLDRICAPLADVVMRTSASQPALEELEEANLFLTPLDDRREWYRFHHLLRDTVRRYMHQTQRESVPAIYARASEWCEANGLMVEAIDYAFAANAQRRAALLIEAYAPTALANGDVKLLLDRLERVPEPLARTRVRGCIAHAYTLFVSGERKRWRQFVRDAERSLAHSAQVYDAPTLAILNGEILTLRAIETHYSNENNPRELIALFQRAASALPLNHVFRPIITLLVGINQFFDGDMQAASRTLKEVMSASEVRGDVFYLSISMLYLCMTAMLQGRLDAALALCNRIEQYVASYDDQDLVARIHMTRGKVFYERNDLEQALEQLRRGISLRYDPAPFLFEGYMAQAYVCLAQGNSAAAHQIVEQTLAEWTGIVAENRSVWAWTGRQIRAHQARLWLLDDNEDNRAAASAWARTLEDGARSPTPGEIAPPTYVQEWERIVLAREYLAEHRAHDALALLDTLYNAAETHGRVARVLEILVLQVVAHDALGDRHAALGLLQRAVELGTSQRFVRIFLDGGQVTQRLLELLHAQHTNSNVAPSGRRDTAHLESLLAAFAPAGKDGADEADRSFKRTSGSRAVETPTHKLTPRQREVIRLVAKGLSNDDIAKELVIALPTVKRHVSNILVELQVRNRTEAVARTQELHLLDSSDQR